MNVNFPEISVPKGIKYCKVQDESNSKFLALPCGEDEYTIKLSLKPSVRAEEGDLSYCREGYITVSLIALDECVEFPVTDKSEALSIKE